MNFLPELLTVTTLHLLAIISPGPDFVLVTRNSLLYSKRTGIYCALGIAAGILVHTTYYLLGIGLLISKSIVLFSIIKYLGAVYLIYIGYMSLRSKPQPVEQTAIEAPSDLTPLAAFKMGFLNNVLNPKVSLFLLALFTQVLDQSTPAYLKIVYGTEMAVMTFVWFSLVSLVFTNDMVKSRFERFQNKIEKVTGVILIGLGIRVAVSK